MAEATEQRRLSLDVSQPIWPRFFLVAPLIVVGTRESDGRHDLAAKHMAMPLGWQNFFGFACTPAHHTYVNIVRERTFTVSFPRASQIVSASLTAAPRGDGDRKHELDALPTFPATTVDGVLLEDAYLFLECELHRIIDGFEGNSLITGRIVAAQVDRDAVRASDQDDQDVLAKAPLLAYVSPGRYATIDRSLSFPFPAGFKR